MNWKIITKYAATVFLAQFMLGFFEGLLFEHSMSVEFSFHAISVVVCGGIFLHLGNHQLHKPFIHAWASLVLVFISTWVLVLLLYRWFGSPGVISIVFEYFLLICSLGVGTSLGIILRQKANRV